MKKITEKMLKDERIATTSKPLQDVDDDVFTIKVSTNLTGTKEEVNGVFQYPRDFEGLVKRFGERRVYIAAVKYLLIQNRNDLARGETKEKKINDLDAMLRKNGYDDEERRDIIADKYPDYYDDADA